jgi:hypothetical protein
MAGVPAAQIIVLTGITATFYYCFTAAVLAARQPHLDSQIAIATDSTTALAVLIAAPYGLYAACIAMLIQKVGMMPGPLVMLRRTIGISPIAVVWSQLPVLGAAAVMGAIVTLCTPLVVRILPSYLAILVLIGIGALTYLPLAMLAAPDVMKHLYRRLMSALNPDLSTV